MDVYTRSGNVFSELKSRTVANSHYYWTVLGSSLIMPAKRTTDSYAGLNEGFHERIRLALERDRDGTTDRWHNTSLTFEAARMIRKQTPHYLLPPNSL